MSAASASQEVLYRVYNLRKPSVSVCWCGVVSECGAVRITCRFNQNVVRVQSLVIRANWAATPAKVKRPPQEVGGDLPRRSGFALEYFSHVRFQSALF